MQVIYGRLFYAARKDEPPQNEPIKIVLCNCSKKPPEVAMATVAQRISPGIAGKPGKLFGRQARIDATGRPLETSDIKNIAMRVGKGVIVFPFY